MARTGAPIKLTPEVRDRLVFELSLGASDDRAGKAAGVSGQSVTNWRRRGEDARAVRDAGNVVPARERPFLEFVDAVAVAVEDVELSAVRVVQRAADGGDWRAAAWLLERVAPERWRVSRSGGSSQSRAGVGGRPVGAVSSPDRVARPGEPPRLSLVDGG